MKVISKIAIVLGVGVITTAGLNSVFAVCPVNGTPFTSNYYDAPIGQAEVFTSGKFWGIGQFDPASPGGTDNGNAPSSTWLRYTPGSGFYMAGDWGSDPLYDGCIQSAPNPQPGRMGVAWTTSDGTDSYFIALCATETPDGTYNSITELPGQAMVRVPKAVIHASSRAGNTTNLTVGHEPVAGTVLNQGACAMALTGFKVYQQTVPRDAPAPAGSRSPAVGWTLLGQGTESAADVVGNVNCATNSDIYLLTTLVFDGNVEIGQGSRNSTRVECGPNLANPTGEGDNQFRLIRKPKNTKGR